MRVPPCKHTSRAHVLHSGYQLSVSFCELDRCVRTPGIQAHKRRAASGGDAASQPVAPAAASSWPLGTTQPRVHPTALVTRLRVLARALGLQEQAAAAAAAMAQPVKTKPVFGEVQQLRPDTSGYNLVVKARGGPGRDGRSLQLAGWAPCGPPRHLASPMTMPRARSARRGPGNRSDHQLPPLPPPQPPARPPAHARPLLAVHRCSSNRSWTPRSWWTSRRAGRSSRSAWPSARWAMRAAACCSPRATSRVRLFGVLFLACALHLALSADVEYEAMPVAVAAGAHRAAARRWARARAASTHLPSRAHLPPRARRASVSSAARSGHCEAGRLRDAAQRQGGHVPGQHAPGGQPGAWAGGCWAGLGAASRGSIRAAEDMSCPVGAVRAEPLWPHRRSLLPAAMDGANPSRQPPPRRLPAAPRAVGQDRARQRAELRAAHRPEPEPGGVRAGAGA